MVSNFHFWHRDAAGSVHPEVIRITNRLCLDVVLNGLSVLEKKEYADIVAKLKRGYSAWVIHTVYDVLEVLKMDLGILEGFKELVSRGGDTDTNCAIYGAICGYCDELEVDLDDYLDKASQRMLFNVL